MPAVWFWEDRFEVVSWFENIDKWLHGLTFLVLAIWFAGQFERSTYWKIGLGLLVFGLIIEVLQRSVSYRTADWADVGAEKCPGS